MAMSDDKGIPETNVNHTTQRNNLLVFNIPELVEEILFYVRMKDILMLLRTSKTFDTTIRQSPRLQEKLFFRPTKLAAPRQLGLLLDMASDSHVNNLLLSFLDVQCRRHACRLNANNAAGVRGTTMSYDFFLHYRRPRERRKAYMPGSWQKMLLLQPPRHEYVKVTGTVVERHKKKGEIRYLHDGQNPPKLLALRGLLTDMKRMSRIRTGTGEN